MRMVEEETREATVSDDRKPGRVTCCIHPMSSFGQWAKSGTDQLEAGPPTRLSIIARYSPGNQSQMVDNQLPISDCPIHDYFAQYQYASMSMQAIVILKTINLSSFWGLSNNCRPGKGSHRVRRLELGLGISFYRLSRDVWSRRLEVKVFHDDISGAGRIHLIVLHPSDRRTSSLTNHH